MFGRDRIEYKSSEQVRVMRRAGLVVADALDAVREATRPGRTTAELDAVAAQVISRAGATPSFLGYHGFSGTVCLSVNEEVVHGIPGERVLQAGDLLSVDCGAVVDGWHGDAAISLVVAGAGADPEDELLVAVTERALWAGIAALVVGGHLGEVGAAVEDEVDGAFGIVEGYVGHGIGTAMHQPPEVVNYRTRDRGPRLKRGLCVAVEPMLVRGSPETRVLADDWTVVTTDGSRAAHWEHSVALFDAGPWVLTARDGGRAGLAPYGVQVAPLE